MENPNINSPETQTAPQGAIASEPGALAASTTAPEAASDAATSAQVAASTPAPESVAAPVAAQPIAPVYKEMSEEDKVAIHEVRQHAHEMHSTMLKHTTVTEAGQPSYVSRELSLARTKLDEAVMWFEKHIQSIF